MTLTKRTCAGVFAALFAVLMALCMAPGSAWAADSWYSDVSHGTDSTSEYGQGWVDAKADTSSDAAKEVAFTVYTKYADEECVPVKEYTRADLLALAQENADMLGTIYNAKGGYSVYVSDCYVTIDQLLANAGKKGTSFNDEDTMYMAEGVDSEGQPNLVVIKGNTYTADNSILDADKMFFPNYSVSADDAVSAPASIAFSWGSASIDTTAKAAAVNAAPCFGDSARLLCGTTSMDAIPAGNQSPSGVTGLIIATPASDKFDVYQQESDSAEPTLAKSYTKETLSALATASTKGFLYYGSSWNVGVTTNSIDVAKLIADAGLTFEEGDTLVFAAPDGFTTKLSYDDVQSEKYFYPNAVGETCDVNGAEEVGTVLALNWQTAGVSESAAATVNSLAAGTLVEQYRVFTGVSEANYTAKAAAGKRFATNPKTLTLIKAEKESNPSEQTVTPTDDTEASPVAQTISAKNVSQTYKAKKGKLAKKKTIKLASAAKVSAQTKVKYAKANKAGKSKIKVAANGKMTIAKGLKAGTYKVKVALKAAASDSYKASSKKITVTIKVK